MKTNPVVSGLQYADFNSSRGVSIFQKVGVLSMTQTAPILEFKYICLKIINVG